MSTPDKIVVISPKLKDNTNWISALKEKNSNLTVENYPDDTEREKTEFVLVWNPPKGIFKKYPNLKVIASMAAGINHIIKDPDIPENISITKVNDPLLKQDLATFVLALTLSHLRNLNLYAQQQAEQLWAPKSYRRPEGTTVGILGIGNIGQQIGKLLVKNDFKVTGWSRSEKHLQDIETFHGPAQKDEFLKTAEILVCILPLTKETKGILNQELFEKLPKKAFLINVGRGGQLVEKDLEKVIKKGQLSGAALDAFQEEPLPQDHPFWKNKKIHITPHTASVPTPGSVTEKVWKNYQHMRNGEELDDVIDISRGY